MKKTRRTFLLAGSIAPVALSVSYAKGNAQMTTYNTGNPLGSKEVKDLFDNAQNFDNFANNKDTRHWPDRFGKDRLTWHGIEEQFQEFLVNAGYRDMGEYAAGLELTARNQMFHKDGELYRASAGLALPYTLTGDWMQEKDLLVAMGDQVLRQQLASTGTASGDGLAMVGYQDDYPLGEPNANSALKNTRDIIYANDIRKFGVVQNKEESQTHLLIGQSLPERLIFPEGNYVFHSIPVGLFEGVVFEAMMPNTVTLQISGAQEFVVLNNIAVVNASGQIRSVLKREAKIFDGNITRQFESFEDYSANSPNTRSVFEGALTWPAGVFNKGSVLTPDTNGKITWGNAAGVWKGVFTSVRPYDLIKGLIDDDTITKGVAIIGTLYTAVLQKSSDNQRYVLFINRADGSGSVSQSNIPLVDPSNVAYESNKASLSIDVINKTTVAILSNGARLPIPSIFVGDIIAVGYVTYSSSVSYSTVFGLHFDKSRYARAPHTNSIRIFGDSMAQPLSFSWDRHLPAALSALGQYVTTVQNYAVGGSTMQAVYNKMVETGFGSAHCVIICAGTNDAQAGFSESGVRAQAKAIVDLVRNAGLNLIWVEPWLWYDNSHGEGSAAVNSDKAAKVRSIIQTEVLRRSGVFVPITHLLPAPRRDLLTSGVDPLLRDNIHPTGVSYQMFAHHIAMAVLGSYVKKDRLFKYSSAFYAWNSTAIKSVDSLVTIDESEALSMYADIVLTGSGSLSLDTRGLLTRANVPATAYNPSTQATSPCTLVRRADGLYDLRGVTAANNMIVSFSL